jgi:hypothetical protein
MRGEAPLDAATGAKLCERLIKYIREALRLAAFLELHERKS